MDELKARLKTLADRIDVLSVRERGLIFFAVMVVLYLIAYSVVFAPLRAEQIRLDKDLSAKREQIRVSDQQVSGMFSHDGQDANSANRAKLAALNERIRSLDGEMDEMTAGVVPPKEMAKLVEEMLTRNKNLELVKLEALPPKPLNGDDAKPQSDNGNAGVTVYRHGMRVEFKGRYFDIVNYLKSLEGLRWKMYWGEVSLEADKYPMSKVTLVIYTLSRYPGWIGV
jgi:MSHA biogenesis protein MshJ